MPTPKLLTIQPLIWLKQVIKLPLYREHVSDSTVGWLIMSSLNQLSTYKGHNNKLLLCVISIINLIAPNRIQTLIIAIKIKLRFSAIPKGMTQD